MTPIKGVQRSNNKVKVKAYYAHLVLDGVCMLIVTNLQRLVTPLWVILLIIECRGLRKSYTHNTFIYIYSLRLVYMEATKESGNSTCLKLSMFVQLFRKKNYLIYLEAHITKFDILFHKKFKKLDNTILS